MKLLRLLNRLRVARERLWSENLRKFLVLEFSSWNQRWKWYNGIFSHHKSRPTRAGFLLTTGLYVFAPGHVYQLTSFGWQVDNFAQVDPVTICRHGIWTQLANVYIVYITHTHTHTHTHCHTHTNRCTPISSQYSCTIIISPVILMEFNSKLWLNSHFFFVRRIKT